MKDHSENQSHYQQHSTVISVCDRKEVRLQVVEGLFYEYRRG